MKLEKIKVTGFKSFVDATTIPISGNLTGIVGPNGCGKSNIIDAVRWVMGESSAKHLRGGNMADVIFNGSSTRKPVSTASVELVFDNSEGRAGGEFAKYNTISIKRQVSRDGQSAYQLNSTRCRRKDITDLFLGTGLGARSYAIIEQGTISRLVESRPEELKAHIEEAAGISKYKERRHETETRMRHTRENLERLDDLRDEVEKQIKHLHKQAQKAEKYSALKKEERNFRLELLAMRWNTYHQTAQQLEEKAQDAAQQYNHLFVKVREIDKETEAKRAEHKSQQQLVDRAQGEFYNAVTDVSRLEQAIKHSERSHEETTQEIQRLQQQLEQSLDELKQDTVQLEELEKNLLKTEQALLLAKEQETHILAQQQEFQQQRLVWQEQWEMHRNRSAQIKEKAEVQRSKITQLENQIRQSQLRMDRLQTEHTELLQSQLQIEIESLNNSIEIIEAQRSEFQIQLETLLHNISEQRQLVRKLHDELHHCRSDLHGKKGKITSLELLQQHAMGKDNKKLGQWLQNNAMSNKQRLAEFLEVEAGWETAVETVLGTYLEAICIGSIDDIIAGLESLEGQSLTVFETQQAKTQSHDQSLPRLLDKVQSPWNLNSLLSTIYCVDELQSARKITEQLLDHQSVISRQGAWFGPGWLRIIRPGDNKGGVLQREKELRLLKETQNQLQTQISELDQQLTSAEIMLKDAEAKRESLQKQDNLLAAELTAKHSEFSAHKARLEHQQYRFDQICNEMDDISQELAENTELLEEAKLIKGQAEQACIDMGVTQKQLEVQNQDLQEQQYQVDLKVTEVRQQVHKHQVQTESLKSSEILTRKQLQRIQQQHQQATDRRTDLEQKLEKTLTPLEDEKAELQGLLLNREQLENSLKAVRQKQEETEAQVMQLTEQHSRTQREQEKHKEILDNIRFEKQESLVRQQTVTEQLAEIGADAEQILDNLPEQAEENDWKNRVDELERQIERLGTINLTAIDEYKSQSERMRFLNEQHQDLMESLETLDQAINKIDKESRQRFKDTFDKINVGLQEKFPRLFGGGHAYLDLTEQDILEAGVNIIARPPGKRNSSIHLLSGGEKALTAVALVFSIFELNPAPFCLLDEVDAPLDDANVVRFSKMVEDMSTSVQFLFISHNKATMEIAKQLAGVTMSEPGVSRMVAVDIEEAVDLAES